jgi:adenylosuccinate lyase
MEGLVVRPDRMLAVLESSYGLVFSQRVLLGLVERGLTREQAYAVVQRNAMRAWDEERPLGELLAADPEVTAHLPASEVAALLDPAWYTRHVPELMQRVAAL